MPNDTETERKENIRSMIDSFVDGNEEQIEMDFHKVLTSRVRDMMGIETNTDDLDVDDLDSDSDPDLDPDSDLDDPDLDTDNS